MLTVSLILLPFLVSLGLFFTKKGFKEIALITSLIEFGLGIIAFLTYDKALALNHTLYIPWIKQLGVSIYFGMDGISLVLVMLSVLLVPFIILSTFGRQVSYQSSFYALILLMQSALIGVFTSMDGLLFYVFWELALIPIYFIAGLWGGENRIRITLKFFIYTMLGSLFMLGALIFLYTKSPAPHAFNLGVLLNAKLTINEQFWVFAAFFVGFAIKVPIFPFHSWQPDTYVTAPTAGSMLLAGIMLKMGIYGILRFLLPCCGEVFLMYGPYILFLAVTGVLYGSIIAIKQQEIKRLIAYSSFAHAGLMAAAIFTARPDALQGSIFQMLSHGINIVALFFVADIIQNRTQTTLISDLGGIAKVAPRFAIFFMITMLGSVALPLTNGFIGEFLMLTGIAKYNIFVAGIAGITIILGAVYMFWLYQRTMYGELKSSTASFADLTVTEMWIAVPTVILIITLGTYPKFILEITKPAVDGILLAL